MIPVKVVEEMKMSRTNTERIEDNSNRRICRDYERKLFTGRSAQMSVMFLDSTVMGEAQND